MKLWEEVILVWVKDPRVIVTLLTTLSSLVGFSSWNWVEAIKEAEASQKQVTAIAKAYYPAIKETLTTKETTTIIKSDCGKCDKLQERLNQHEQRHKAGYLY